MVYLRVSGRFEVQVAVLTGHGTMGNYNMHTIVKVVHEGRVFEVPAVTGNSLKHWHAVYAAEAYEALGGKSLNEFCRKGVGIRGRNLEGSEANSESDAIKDFCNDLHGFLLPQKQIKRDSLVKFAFGIPVLSREVLESVSKFAVTHNKVDPTQTGERGEMMVFRQEYASGHLYGFAASMDLAYLMVPVYETPRGGEVGAVDSVDEKVRRAKAAFAGLLKLMSGGYGSKAARALPISNLKEVVVAISRYPLPQLVHGAYPDYVARSIDALNAYLSILGGGAGGSGDVTEAAEGEGGRQKAVVVCYGVSCPPSGLLRVVEVNSLQQLSLEVLAVIEELIKGEKAGI